MNGDGKKFVKMKVQEERPFVNPLLEIDTQENLGDY